MNYFTNTGLLELQGDIINFIELNFSDCVGYEDFIDLIAYKDINKELILNEIDRDYLNDFIEYKELYAIIDSEEDLNEMLIYNEDYINYFMDYSLIALLDYFTEITFIELLSYVNIYKFKDDYYAIWDI